METAGTYSSSEFAPPNLTHSEFLTFLGEVTEVQVDWAYSVSGGLDGGSATVMFDLDNFRG